jgi:hypothetical protein
LPSPPVGDGSPAVSDKLRVELSMVTRLQYWSTCR